MRCQADDEENRFSASSPRRDLKMSTTKSQSTCRIANIVPDDAMILAHAANPDGSNFRKGHPYKQRFPGSLRIAPNWRGFVCAFCLCKLSIGFHVPFWRLCLRPAKSRFPPLLLSPWFYGHWHAVSRPQGDETLRFDGMASLEA
jgi:hypothetical protein